MTIALDKTSRSKIIAAEIGKIGVAAGLFVTIVGGYLALADADMVGDADAVLPNGGATGPCTLWFVGSSTVFKWNTLSRDMAPWDARQRGVNGALIPDIARRFDHDPPGPPPVAIVWYAGENDIAAGASGQAAFEAFDTFMARKTRRYGALPVIAISLKPSPSRWRYLPEQTRFNNALRRYAAGRTEVRFVDIRPLLLQAGRPGPFYVGDGVHLNAEGYRRWTRLLRPILARVLPADRVSRCGARGPIA